MKIIIVISLIFLLSCSNSIDNEIKSDEKSTEKLTSNVSETSDVRQWAERNLAKESKLEATATPVRKSKPTPTSTPKLIPRITPTVITQSETTTSTKTNSFTLEKLINEKSKHVFAFNIKYGDKEFELEGEIKRIEYMELRDGFKEGFYRDKRTGELEPFIEFETKGGTAYCYVSNFWEQEIIETVIKLQTGMKITFMGKLDSDSHESSVSFSKCEILQRNNILKSAETLFEDNKIYSLNSLFSIVNKNKFAFHKKYYLNDYLVLEDKISNIEDKYIFRFHEEKDYENSTTNYLRDFFKYRTGQSPVITSGIDIKKPHIIFESTNGKQLECELQDGQSRNIQKIKDLIVKDFNQKFKVSGRIDYYDNSLIHLTNCEIIFEY